MGIYSIKELEKLSGIKAHTIRIWEKRYNVITPKRTPTNIRYYSDDDLKKILNISILNNHGHKISKIALLSNADITRRVSEISIDESDNELLIDELTICMIELDEVKFDKLLSNYIIRFGLEQSFIEIVYPFLEKVGILWLSNHITPIQEHFVSNLVRQKIIVAIDGLTLNIDKSAEKVILFLPEHELHELGLLFYYFILKKAGFRTYYLGQAVPLPDLEQAARALAPEYMVTCVTTPPPHHTCEEFVTLLSKKFHSSEVFVTGHFLTVNQPRLPKNIHQFKHAKDLKNILAPNT